MNHDSRFASEIIRASAEGLAAVTAQKMLEAHPDLHARYSPSPFTQWKDSISTRLHYLAISLASGRPELFAHQIAWAHTAHTSRGVPVEDLRRSVACLYEVVAAELPKPAADAAQKVIEGAMHALDSAAEPSESFIDAGLPHATLAAEYLLAILDGERSRAVDLIVRAVDSGVITPPEVYSDVICRVQQELGRLWHVNELAIGEEHFATATAQLVVSLMYPRLPRKPRHGKSVVAGSVDGNAHDLAVRMLADYLEMDGWRVVFLGASVPSQDFAHAAEAYSADLVALSATLATQLPAVADATVAIRARAPKCRILVGGSGFSGQPDLWRQYGADAYAGSFAEAVSAARDLALKDA